MFILSPVFGLSFWNCFKCITVPLAMHISYLFIFFFLNQLINSVWCGEDLSSLDGSSNYKPALTPNSLLAALSVWAHFFTGANSASAAIWLWTLLRSNCYSDAAAAIAALTSTATGDGEGIQSRQRLTFTSFFFFLPQSRPIQTSIASGITWHAMFTFMVHA